MMSIVCAGVTHRHQTVQFSVCHTDVVSLLDIKNEVCKLLKMLLHELFSALIFSVIPLHVICSSFSFSCENEWTKVGKKCYLVHDYILTTFPDAISICDRSYLGELVTITSEEEQRLLQNYIEETSRKKHMNSRIWMGGIRASLANHDASFYWIGGRKFTYTNWKEGEPNNYNHEENCIAFELNPGKSVLWFDHRCDDHLGIMCQKRLNTTTEDKEKEKAEVLLSAETERTYKLWADVKKEIYQKRTILIILVIVSMSITVLILMVFFCGQYKN